ncbi:MAG TPA: ROK family protein [Aggregatilineales bacterium]|nr:ROK family protein [Aggregatilineales bacterium]
MPQDVYIGVDIGGTRVRAACLSPDLNIITRTETASLASEGRDAVIERIFGQVQAVWPTDGSRVLGLGISAPGPVNPKTGVVVMPPNLDGWHNVPLRDICREKFGVETYLGNDANLAALAETDMGAGRGYQDVLFLTISTGIGGGVITGGKMLVGAEGLGAECGHIIMIVEGENVSTFEKEAAGPAIARQARAAMEAGEKSSILELAGGKLDNVNTKHVSEAAKAGDKLALRLVTRAGKIIGLGITSFLLIFNPQIVVLGGGVIEGTWELLRGPMMEAIQTYSLDPEYWNHLEIKLAALGENVSLVGAAALALHQGAQ